MPSDNGWSEYQRLVLAELKRLDASVHAIKEEMAELRVAVEVLRTRAVTWGALGGAIIWVSTVVAQWVTRR